MDRTMIPRLVATLVEHQGTFAALRSTEYEWINANPDKAISLFINAVRMRDRSANEPPVGRYYATVTLGIYQTKEELLGLLEKVGRSITYAGLQLLEKIAFFEIGTAAIDLYSLNFKDLGLEDAYSCWKGEKFWATRNNLNLHALAVGFKMLPPEVGPLIATIEWYGESSVSIAMEPVYVKSHPSCKSSDLNVFKFNGQQLDGRVLDDRTIFGEWLFAWPHSRK